MISHSKVGQLLVPLVCLLLVFVMIAGIKGLSLSNDYTIYFDREEPRLKQYEALLDTYSKNDNILIGVSRNDQSSIFNRQDLSVIEDLTTAAWKIPYSRRVDSLTNVQHSFVTGDELEVADLVLDANQISNQRLSVLRDVAVTDPQIVNFLVSPDTTAASVNIIFQLPGKSLLEETPTSVNAVRELVDTFEQQYPHLEFHLAGQLMLSMAFPETSRADMKQLYKIMFLLIIVLLIFFLRSVTAVILTMVVVVLSGLAGMGTFGWFNVQLAPIATAVPVMIMCLALANCVHISLAYFSQRSASDVTPLLAMREALRVNIRPVIIANVTTAIGFLTLNSSQSPPFQLLGNMVAVGVLVSAVLSLLFYPPLLLLLGSKKVPSRSIKASLFDNLGDWVVKHPKQILLATVLFLVLVLAQVPRNELNETTLDYFSEETQFRQDSDWVNQRLTGVMSAHFSIPSGHQSGVTDPVYLQHLDEFTQWLRTNQGVVSVRSFAETMKKLNRNMNGGDEAFYGLPDEQQLASQYLLLYELSLPYGLDLRSVLNVDKSASKVSVSLKKMSSVQLRDFEARANTWIEQNLPTQMQSTASSSNIIFAHIGQQNVESMLSGIAFGILLISIIVAFTLRSLLLGAISLLCNALPFLLALGFWGLGVGEIGLGVSVVAGMALGIVVDDTVHFLSKYQYNLKQGLGSREAVSRVFGQIGLALTATTVSLVAGFLILANSNLSLNVDMGIMTALTIGIALVLDFLFLPALLILFHKRSAHHG